MITQPKPDRLYDSARELATNTGYASATLFRRYFSNLNMAIIRGEK